MPLEHAEKSTLVGIFREKIFRGNTWWENIYKQCREYSVRKSMSAMEEGD